MGGSEIPFGQYISGLVGIGVIMPIFFFILIFFFFVYIKCIKPMRAKSFSEMIKKNVVVRLDNGKIARVHDGKEIRNGAFLINKNEVVRVIDGKVVHIHQTGSEMTTEGLFTGVLIGTAPLGLDPINELVGGPGSSGPTLDATHFGGSGNGGECGGGHLDCSTSGGHYSGGYNADCSGADCYAFGGGD